MSKTIEIKAESGISVEIKRKWFKIVYSETKTISEDDILEEERKKLFDQVNSVVDNQINEIYQSFNS